MTQREQGVLAVQRIGAGDEDRVNGGRGAQRLRRVEEVRDMEVLRVFAGALLVAAPDAGELRALRMIESWREAALSVMAEAKNAVPDHAIHASFTNLQRALRLLR
jgi:hypothetical protein